MSQEQKPPATLIEKAIADLRGDFGEFRTAVLGRMDALEREMKDLKEAFPAGDVDGHRRYHELMIERNAELRRLRVAVQEKTISGLVWAFIVFSAFAAWHFVRFKLGIQEK